MMNWKIFCRRWLSPSSGTKLTFECRDWRKLWRTSACLATCPRVELGTYRIQV